MCHAPVPLFLSLPFSLFFSVLEQSRIKKKKEQIRVDSQGGSPCQGREKGGEEQHRNLQLSISPPCQGCLLGGYVQEERERRRREKKGVVDTAAEKRMKKRGKCGGILVPFVPFLAVT